MSKHNYKVGDRVWAIVGEKKERLATIVSIQYDNPVEDCFELNFDGLNYPVWRFKSEIRPAGEPAKIEGGGTKHDLGKPDMTLVERTTMEAIARGLGYGAKKYRRNLFKEMKNEDIHRIYAALLRHIFKKISGETTDDESGLNHTDHIASCVNIICYLEGKHGESDIFKQN